MLPPPVQPVQKINFKSEKSPNRPSTHKKWQDAVSAESNVRPSIVFPYTAQTAYDYKLNSNADDVNKLLSPTYVKSTHPKKSWLQDLLQKEVARPSPQANVQTEALTMLKLDDKTRYYTTKMPVEYVTGTLKPFLPTVQPMIADDKFLFQEMAKPINPMNLIIQGHSRVKTYGLGTDGKNAKIIEVKSAENPVVNRVVSQDENGIRFDVKHLHASSQNTTVNTHPNATRGTDKTPAVGLLSLLDLSFGDLLDNGTMPDASKQTKSNEIKAL